MTEPEPDRGRVFVVKLRALPSVIDQHIGTIKLWRGEFGLTPPFDIGPNTLFVAYSAWAEMTCFLQLGWQFPTHILDLHTAYLSVSNILLPYDPDEEKRRKKSRKRLPDACRAYGIEGWENIDKKAMQEDIGAGNWRQYGREGVLGYCEEDVRMTTQLLRRMLPGHGRFPPIDVPRVLHWSNYSAKCIARIQARGIPIDTVLWNLVQENKGAVIGELLRRFDPSYGSDDPIYTPEGEWSYDRFERWLLSVGILAWPRLDSGQLDTDGLRRVRDRRGRGSNSARQRTLQRQARRREENVGDHHVRAGSGAGNTAEGVTAMDYVMRHGRRIEIETVDTGIAPKPRKGFVMRWVKLPRHWITGLGRSESVNTYRLAHRILWAAYEDKRGNGVVTLSKRLALEMPRNTRIRAAQELIKFGLIVLIEKPRKGRAMRVKVVY